MTVMNEEIFGPIVPIQRVESDDEAVALANRLAPRPERVRVHEGPREGAEARRADRGGERAS